MIDEGIRLINISRLHESALYKQNFLQESQFKCPKNGFIYMSMNLLNYHSYSF